MKTLAMLCAAVSAASVALPSLGGDWFHPDCEPETGVAIMDDPCTGTVKPIQRRNFVQAGSGRAATPEVVDRVRRWNAAVGFSKPEVRYDVNFPKPQPMPCLSDAAVRERIAADFRAWKAKGHAKKRVYLRLCCNDTGKWCECDKCRALMTPERGLTGVASDYWWTFVNALAAEVLNDPLVSLDAFVYRNYQDFPLKVKPLRHPRLSVVLCPHGRCYTHSLNDRKCPKNGRYLAMFRQWIDYGMPINTFEYHNQTPGRCNYAFWERAWIEDVKWYAKSGVSHGDGNFLGPWAGMRRQDNYYRNNAARARWQIAWLTAYFDQHPEADFDAVRNRLFAAYYRAAARPMTAYRNLLEKAFLDSGICMEYGLGRNLFFVMASRPGLLSQARRLLDEADELAVGDEELVRRIGWDREYFRSNLELCGFDRVESCRTLALPATLDDFRLCKGAGDVPIERQEKYPKRTSVRVSREGAKLVFDISGDPGGEFRIQYMTAAMKGVYRNVPANYGRNEIEVGGRGIVRVNVTRNEKGAPKPFGSSSGYPWFIPDYWHYVQDYADVVVYGSTPAGFSAAIQARRMGRSVIVLEPTSHVGGLTTGGLGQTDIGSKEAFGGIAREFYRDIRRHYMKSASWVRERMSDYPLDGKRADPRNADTMWTFEPSAASAVLSGWEEKYGLSIVRNARLRRGGGGVVSSGGRISAIRLEDGTSYGGGMFVDATYEGDLMAEAGVSYVVGREANAEYGETLNGQQPVGHPYHNFDVPVDPYVVPGDPSSGLLPGIDPSPMGRPGEGDGRVQAYCYRMTLTDDPANRIPFEKPEGYDEREYELLFRNYEAGERTSPLPWINSRMPNRKTDTNNKRAVSTDFIGRNHAWPEASYAEREAIAKAHLDYQKGLMWTLANHPRVPKAVRDEVAKWGLCRDEFADRGGWTPQLYVREARRMVGDYVMTEKNCTKDAFAPRPVALAAYQMDSHHVRRYVTPEGRVRNEGDVEVGCRRGPFGIDYASIVPRRGECANLLVPVCLSASHIAFGSIRMEPVFFALGQAAGTAACLSLADGVAVQDLDYSRLRDRLVADGQRIEPSDGRSRFERQPTDLGEPVPKVLVGDDPVDRIAAGEFVKYYRLMTGVSPEVAERAGEGDAVVRIGRSFAKGLGFDAKLDSYRIKSTRENGRWCLLLAGGNARSTMYAVYEFYKSLGCRWFWDGDKVPEAGVVNLSGQDVYEVSRFEWRGTRYFAHRGLRRFSAEMWGFDDWRREIDWLLKNRLNLFFFRLGTDDLFQKAFPEHCRYPDASKPLPGQLEGYDNRSLFWPLEYRGALRKELTDYAFDRGLMIPPDFGTITHWYTRTPQDFLDGVKPDFLPEPAKGYAANDSGKVWDVRQDRWVEAYWKLTEAEIANYGRKPGPLHTIGFSERNIYTNRADNFRLKKDTTARLFARALKSYPDATILFAGWDFYSTWTPEEIKAYLPTLDPKHVVILDYEANAYRSKVGGRYSNFTEWDIVGKFPYIFGTFFYESGTPIHTDYDLIARRRKFAENDPMCKGCVLWPEASHVDVLELRHFTDNAWRFAPQTVPELIEAFCHDRYGEHAAAFAEVWRKVLPISVACSSKQGPWRANYADMAYTYLGSAYSLARPESYPAHGRKAYASAPSIFRAIAGLPRRDAWQRRDAADLARTVGDRLVMEAVCDAQRAWFAWRDGEPWATPAAVLGRADAALRFVGLMGRVLAQHGDFSLCDTFAATDEIERIRLPNFDQVLLQNAINGYCLSHQAEAAVHLYPAMYRSWRDELAKALERGDRAASLTGAGVRGHVAEFWKRRLRDLRTAEPRTDDNWRATMLEFAAAAEGWLDVP